jgi:hypothetical protein
MATQNINIGINVSDNGTAKKTVKSFQEITQAATQAQSAAAGISAAPVKSTLAPGGTPGSRRASEPAGSQQMMSGQDYGSARGSAGLTGASARDFANQAQGLGGLVRLYATYAANVFAVSAAFTALSNAADTANLIKGMNQIGAASGVALGSLSKRLVEVTDGAISMREAMETVTKGISSGMSTNQILEIGNVAKKASQALGVDMTDAVSRLSRGITKLEPELLDELGIFTKIDPAVQKYAQSIGRAANSLSDFERRQAFAIAVLEEGNKKFGAIELDANPYAKFLATLKDVGFTVLDVVNKAVVPLVSYLSQSPTALLTVLGAIGTLIVRQALPAFGQFRAGLESAAESAKERAIARAQDAAAAQKSISESLKQATDARVEAEVERVVIAEKRIMDIKQGSVKKQSALYKILEKDLQDINEKDLKKIESSAKSLTTKGLTAEAKAYRDVADAVRGYQRESANEEKARAREQAILEKNVKWYSIEGITKATAEKAKQQAVRASIVSNTAYQASLVGVTRAMIAANAAITKEGITGFAAFTLQVKAGAAAIGGALATIGTAINRLLGVVGILLTAYSILDSFLDGASKEIGNFDSAVDKANSSAEALSKTYETIYKNDPFSAQSVQARGTALMEVADGFAEIAKAAREAQKAIDQSWWAQLKEGIGLSGVNRNFGKSIATQLTSILKNIDDPAAKKSLEDAARSQLGITELSFDKIAEAAKRLGASSKEIEKLQDSILGVATQAKIAGVASSQFAESYLKVVDQIGKINQKFAVSDDIAQFSINSGNALKDLETLMTQGVASSIDGVVKALEGIGTGTNIFGSMSNQLVPLIEDAKSFKQQFSEGSKEVDQFGKKLDELNAKEIDESKFKIEALGFESFDQSGFNEAVQELNNQRIETAKSFAQAIARTNKAKADAEGVILKVQATLPKAMADSTNLLGIRLASQLAKASTQVLQGSYASFDAVPELVAKSTQLKLKEIDAQIANTKALRDLTTATVLSAAQQKVTSAEAAVNSSEGTGTQATAMANLATAKTELNLLETAVKNPIEALKLLAIEQENNTEIGKRLASQVKELAAKTVEYTSALQQQNQQRLSEQLEGRIAVTNASIKQQQNLLKLKQDEIKLGGEQLNLLAQQENIGLDTKEQLNTQIALNREYQAEIVYRQRVLDLAKTLAEQSVRASALPEADRKTAMTSSIKSYDSGVEAAAAQKAQDIEKARLDLLKGQTAVVIERINREEAAYNRAADFAKVSSDNALQLKQIKLDTELGVQSALLANSQLTETRRAEIEYQSTLQLAALEAERTKIQANQEFERQANINTFAQRKLLAADTGEDGLTAETIRKLGEINELEKVQKATRDGSIVQADALYNKTILIADAIRQVSLEQAKFSELMAQTDSLGQSLTAVFGNVGTAIGNAVTGMVKLAKTQADNDKRILDAKAKLAEYEENDNSDAKTKAIKDLAKAETARTTSELDGISEIAGNTKKMFKEKTAAYKAFSAIEKTLHAISMAIKIKEMIQDGIGLATKLATNGAGMASDVIAAGVSGVKAVVSAIQGPFPMNVIAGAATAAVVAGLLSQIGGSGPSVGGGGGFVPTAEQRQETQGTAMGWDSRGNKVQVREGVFGDTDAKSEAIANSLELIKDNAIEGLYYDNRAVTLLESINKNIGGAAKNLYGIQGLRTGSMFGTVTGSQSGGGFLGTGLFGSKTSRNITDSGLLIEGTFAQLASDTNKAVIDFFEQVTTTKKKWYGSSSTSVDIKRTEIDDATSQFFQDVFGNATKLFKVYAEKTGDITTQQVDQILGDLKIDNSKFVSLRGLKGEEFEAELSAIIGSELSDASMAIFGSFKKFREFGEDMLQTTARVIDTNDKVSVALAAMGSSFDLSGAVGKVLMEVRDTDSLGSKLRNVFGLRTKTILQEMDVAAANALREEYLAADRASLAGVQSRMSELKGMENSEFLGIDEYGTAIFGDLIDNLDGEIANLKEKETELTASIKNLSVPIIDTLTYDISEALVELAGGLEEFTSRSNFFIQNFLSESEQLGLYQETVSQTLRDLELPTELSREQYTALVQAQDKNTKAGRRTFDGLMKLAPAFDKVASRAESFSEPIRDLEIELLRATGRTQEYESATRALAISGFTAAEIASYDLRKSLEAEVKEADRVTSSLDRLAQESLMLSANLLKAQGDMEGYSAAIAAIETKDMKTAQELAAYNNNQSLKRQIESTEAANRAAEQAAQEAKRAAEEAAQKAQQVADQKLSLEQRIYSIQGNTNKLRELELRNVHSSNQALQSYVWALEDYTNILKETEDTIKGLRETATDEYLSASDKVVDAQKAIADLAIEAAKKMRDFGSSLREFVNEQLMPESSANVTRLFTQTVQGALSGDEQALDSVRDIATQAIEAAKASARTSVEFNKARSTILASVSDVAAYAEAQAALTEIPEEDPLVLANKTLEEALKEQTDALYVANTIGASLVKSQEDLVALYFAAQSRVPSAPIAPFANGGIFDNDIIRRPTYFNLGLMGEAGAEAIMPLTRTRDGSLGVVATSEPNTNLGRAIGTQNAALVEQVKLLREEVSLLRYEARATAVSTTKTTRILERVTQNGESLLVTDTATL